MLLIAVLLHVVNHMRDHSICSTHNCSFIRLRWWNVLSFLFIGNNEENSKSSQASAAVDCACLIVSSQGRTESLAAINMQYFLRLEKEREKGERESFLIFMDIQVLLKDMHLCRNQNDPLNEGKLYPSHAIWLPQITERNIPPLMLKGWAGTYNCGSRGFPDKCLSQYLSNSW